MPRDTYDMTIRVTQGDELVFEGRSEAPGETRAEAEGAMRAFWALFHKAASVEISGVKARPRKAAAAAGVDAGGAAAAGVGAEGTAPSREAAPPQAASVG